MGCLPFIKGRSTTNDQILYSRNSIRCWKVVHACTKHIKVQHHFIHEKGAKHENRIEDVQTGYQVANIFTKALAKSKLELFVDALGVSDCKHALMGSVKI